MSLTLNENTDVFVYQHTSNLSHLGNLDSSNSALSQFHATDPLKSVYQCSCPAPW